ncbi:hypothetical protein ABIB15_002539 [Marisediminicola sp. UYEF4]|uniref:hypothetical protein n=1 Tax=Marisediminicola sp. UYEF4 TaxID=1756384 RepID=UPI00339ACFE3
MGEPPLWEELISDFIGFTFLQLSKASPGPGCVESFMRGTARKTQLLDTFSGRKDHSRA